MAWPLCVWHPSDRSLHPFICLFPLLVQPSFSSPRQYHPPFKIIPSFSCDVRLGQSSRQQFGCWEYFPESLTGNCFGQFIISVIHYCLFVLTHQRLSVGLEMHLMSLLIMACFFVKTTGFLTQLIPFLTWKRTLVFQT